MNTLTTKFLECESRTDLALVLGIPLRVLTDLAYSKRKKYVRFSLKKRDGTDRMISAPIPKLKNLQKKLKEIFEDIYKTPACVYGFVKDRGAIENARQHLRKKAILNFDLENFFPTINGWRLLGLFRSKPFNFNNEISSTLAGLVCHDNRLPQGAPTSPILSNFIGFSLDLQLIQLAKKDRLVYTRYADDITLSSRSDKFPAKYFYRDEEIYVVAEELSNLVAENGFKVNPRKTRFYGKNKPHYVTGVKTNIKTNVSRKSIRQVRAMLHAWKTFGPEKAEEHFNNKYNPGANKKFIDVVRGKIDYIKQVRGGELDLVYARLYNEFVELEGRGRPRLEVDKFEKLFKQVQVVKTKEWQGSGFLLRNKYLITCAHLIEGDDPKIEYFNYNEFSVVSRHNGRLIYKSSESDIAIISIDGKDQSDNELSFTEGDKGRDLPIGEEVYGLGFPAYIAGNPPDRVPLPISSFAFNQYGIKEFRVSTPMFPGMSGGPVLDKDNKVVGMVTRGARNTEHIQSTIGFMFLPLRYIDQALDYYERQPSIKD